MPSYRNRNIIFKYNDSHKWHKRGCFDMYATCVTFVLSGLSKTHNKIPSHPNFALTNSIKIFYIILFEISFRLDNWFLVTKNTTIHSIKTHKGWANHGVISHFLHKNTTLRWQISGFSNCRPQQAMSQRDSFKLWKLIWIVRGTTGQLQRKNDPCSC